jgi:hypothetical protein
MQIEREILYMLVLFACDALKEKAVKLQFENKGEKIETRVEPWNVLVNEVFAQASGV